MKLAKTLAAAVLLAGATGAQASQLSATGAFLQVYDSVKAQTYDLNLEALKGLNEAALLTSGSFSVDLSQDANWVSFNSGLSAATASWGVTAAGVANQFVITSNNSSVTKYTSLSSLDGSRSNISQAASRINLSLVGNSVIVADAIADQGGWAVAPNSPATLANIWGTNANIAAGIAYGSTGNFFEIAGVNTGTGLNKKLSETDTLLGTWNLSGNTLSFVSASAPAAVPLPAAVWMFGAGLMGFLGMTRRKSQAV